MLAYTSDPGTETLVLQIVVVPESHINSWALAEAEHCVNTVSSRLSAPLSLRLLASLDTGVAA